MTPPRPKSRLAPAMIVTGVLLAVFAAYPTGYLVLGHNFLTMQGVQRQYSTKWQALLFIPAAAIEAKARGWYVELYCYQPRNDGLIDIEYVQTFDP